MTKCTLCGKITCIDERIDHNGKMVCGHCFMELGMPRSQDTSLTDAVSEPAMPDEAILQLMTLLVDHEERIKKLEDKIGI
jgi:hypothetical protein